MIGAYIDRYQAAAEHDIALAGQFFKVAGLLEPPARLLRPSTVLRVLAGNLRHRPAPAAGTTPAAAHTTARAARSPRPAATHRREDAARR
jgi:hypothetical protein